MACSTSQKLLEAQVKFSVGLRLLTPKLAIFMDAGSSQVAAPTSLYHAASTHPPIMGQERKSCFQTRRLRCWGGGMSVLGWDRTCLDRPVHHQR